MVYSSGRPFILMDVRVVCLPPEVDEPQAPTPAGAAALPAPDQASSHALGQWQYRDVVPGSGEVGEVWCRGPTVFSGTLLTPSSCLELVPLWGLANPCLRAA